MHTSHLLIKSDTVPKQAVGLANPTVVGRELSCPHDHQRPSHSSHARSNATAVCAPSCRLSLLHSTAHACSHDMCIHPCLQGSTQQFSSERTTATCGQLASGNTMDEAASGGGGSATVVMEETLEDGAAAAMSTTRECARATRNDEQLRVAETLRAGRRATFANSSARSPVGCSLLP